MIFFRKANKAERKGHQDSMSSELTDSAEDLGISRSADRKKEAKFMKRVNKLSKKNLGDTITRWGATTSRLYPLL